MTIRPGEQWGVQCALPPDGVVAGSDAEAAAIARDHVEQGLAIPPIGLIGGDLCRTLGGPRDLRQLSSDQAVTFTCDLGVAALDEQRYYFVAHLVSRRQWWRGRAFLAMNASWLGTWNAGPRAHPGDALLDIYEMAVALGERTKVRARLPLGAHLPHPGIRPRRASKFSMELPKRDKVYLDGICVGGFRHLDLGLIPDALTIVI